MQSDKSLDVNLRNSSAWEQDEVTGKSVKELKRIDAPSLQRASMSFSGHERNHLFMNRNGKSFEDVSGISGLNSDADSRSFAVLDFDRDGWQDIVLASVTSPVISFFRNQMGEIESNSENRMLVVDCIGGNTAATASTQFGNRDGFGVKVKVFVGDDILVREKRSSEGLAAQNSQLLHFGLGANSMANKIEIHWPSGMSQEIENVMAGSLVRVFEDAARSSSPNAIEVTKLPTSSKPVVGQSSDDQLTFRPQKSGNAEHQIYVSMATWCPNCKKQLPQLRLIQELVSKTELQAIGVPVDGRDSDTMLSKYQIENNPTYELSGRWAKHDREAFNTMVKRQLEFDSLPATILTNKQGQVLEIFSGVPTLSELVKSGVRFKDVID